MAIAVIGIACGGKGSGGGGGTSANPAAPTPTDTTTISSNASVTIGACQTVNCNPPGVLPSLQVFAAPRLDSRIPCANGCPFNFTFLNHSIVHPAERATQFVGVVAGNYELIAEMTTPSLTVSFGPGGGMAAQSGQVFEGPNAVLTCEPNLVATFSQPAGGAPQRIRMVVVARAQNGAPKCEGAAAVPPPVTSVPPSTTPSTSTANLHALWVESPTDVHAVGDAGTILHYDGTTWTDQASGTTRDLYAIGKGATRMAVGAGGTILSYDGSRWTPMASGTTNALHSIADPLPRGSSSTFAAGAAGTILFFDGTSWRPQDSGTTRDLHVIGGSAITDVFATADGGTLLHYDGVRWTPLVSGTTNALYGGTSRGSTLHLIVGDRGTMIRSIDGGRTFGVVAPFTSSNLRGAVADAATIVAVGHNATVLRSADGLSWTSELLGWPVDLDTVDAEQGITFAAGTGGAIFRHDGRTWVKQR